MKVTLKKIPLYESFDFDNDKEDFNIDVRKIRTSSIVKEISKLYSKLKRLSPAPTWFLYNKHDVLADVILKSGPDHRVICTPIVRMKINGRYIVISSEGTFNTRYGMTPISEMPDYMYNKVMSKLEDYLKDAKSFGIKVSEKVKKF